MTDFAKWFQETFAQPFPVGGICPLHRADENLWVSQSLQPDLPKPPMTPEFWQSPETYTIAGMWGYGVGSYAFYFIDVRGSHRRFFRLHYGSVYSDTDEDSARLVKYLKGYATWRDSNESKTEASTLIHNMGVDKAELTVDGADLVVARSGLGSDWWAVLAQEHSG